MEIDKKETVKDRLIKFIKSLGIGKTKFEKIVGLSNGYVNKLKNAPGADKLASIEKSYPLLSHEWLMTGAGEMLKSGSGAKEIGRVYIADQKGAEVVSVGFVPVAAYASFVASLADSVEWEEKVPIIPKGNERNDLDALKIFEVEGDSMFPTLVSGATILAKEIPEKDWHYAEGVVVVVYGEYVVLKRVSQNRLFTDNFIVLSSDNERYGDMTVLLFLTCAVFIR